MTPKDYLGGSNTQKPLRSCIALNQPNSNQTRPWVEELKGDAGVSAGGYFSKSIEGCEESSIGRVTRYNGLVVHRPVRMPLFCNIERHMQVEVCGGLHLGGGRPTAGTEHLQPEKRATSAMKSVTADIGRV